VPAISGCHAWGQTPEEAQVELLNVFDMIREEYEEKGRMLPDDVDVKAVYACQTVGQPQFRYTAVLRYNPRSAFKRLTKAVINKKPV
jgi:hypothetical protein